MLQCILDCMFWDGGRSEWSQNRQEQWYHDSHSDSLFPYSMLRKNNQQLAIFRKNNQPLTIFRKNNQQQLGEVVLVVVVVNVLQCEDLHGMTFIICS